MSEADATAGTGRVTRVLMIAAHLSVIRTLYLSVRHRGWCIVARGTRLKISPRARIVLTPGSRLYLGFGLTSFTGSRCFVRLGPGARLSVDGTVQLVRRPGSTWPTTPTWRSAAAATSTTRPP